jgi:hypothetical protein
MAMLRQSGLRQSGVPSPAPAVIKLALEMIPAAGPDVKPVPPGTVVAPVSVTAEQLQPLLIAGLGALSVAADVSPPPQVIWYERDSEVLVHLDRTLVRLGPGLVLVALTLQTDQAGAGQVTVPLSIGSPQLPAGLVVVTESRPRGPAALADRWGDAAVAAAWRALLDASHALALQAGIDTSGARLVPGAISSDGKTFAVVPQARYAIDAVAGR